MTFLRHAFISSWTGLVPAIRRGSVPLLMAGTNPAMTM